MVVALFALSTHDRGHRDEDYLGCGGVEGGHGLVGFFAGGVDFEGFVAFLDEVEVGFAGVLHGLEVAGVPGEAVVAGFGVEDAVLVVVGCGWVVGEGDGVGELVLFGEVGVGEWVEGDGVHGVFLC